MLVNYQINGGSGWTLLFNNAQGDANEKFAPEFRDVVNKVGGYGAPNVVKVPLANTDGSVVFRWQSKYATPDAALAAIVALRGTFKGQLCALQVINGATTVYFHNATLTGSSHDQQYCAVTHTLTFATDDITLT